MQLLEYENQILVELFEENALLILCEGLGLDRIFLSLLRLYSDLKELVFVLNTDEFQREYYVQRLKELGIERLPVTVTSDISASERQKLYAQGGVYFMSSRILVMDLLVERIPIDLVTGMLVTKAHKMIDASQESFILRLYREKNKTGFIKGVTDNPGAFMGEYAKLEKAMKNLFVGKVMLWPRFHANILSCLKKHEPEVIEVGVAMTEQMTGIQTCLLEIITACLQEIKSYNPGLDTEEFTLEKSLGVAFDRSIKAQLDPIWNQIGSKTKNLVSDLRMLRSVLHGLTQYDSVTFLKMVENLTATEKAVGKNVGWLFLDAADKLFLLARRRVHGDRSKKKKEDLKEADLVLEEPPKWKALLEVLNDIREANKQTSKTDLGAGKVLICANDFRTINVLHTYLTMGARSTSIQTYNRLFRKFIQVPITSGEGKGSLSGSKGAGATPNGDFEKSSSPSTSKGSVSAQDKNEEEFQTLIPCLDDPVSYLHALHGNADPYSLTKALDSVEPRFVVLYNSSVHIVRQLEVYKACRPGMPFRVYVFTYESSTEEQVYLTSIRREKEAFNSLIKEKGAMVIPKEIEGKTDCAPRLSRDPKAAYVDPQDFRKAGGQKDNVEHRIVIDMREFRSELPSLLYKRGINIEPLTIEVGDYIVTSDICVERKSLADLIGSLNSGRLYNQCVSMSRHYTKPMLMIEFDATKAFSFKARGVTANTSLKELNQKLTLLIIHFPMLRLAWCPSPSIAAEFFHEIKVGREQPSGTKAAAVGTGSGEEGRDEKARKYNSAAYDFLLKLPGVDMVNCKRILHHVKNFVELAALSEEQMADILDSKANAQQLYEFFNRAYSPDKLQAPKATKTTSKYFKGKKPTKAVDKSQKTLDKQFTKS